MNSQLSNQKQSLSQTTTREILAVVFDKQADSYLSGRINGEAKKVKLIMDNMDGWKYSMNIIINGKRQRGYININK